jgi:dTDP-4-amino-4,6-dideoxygalactose transaminase
VARFEAALADYLRVPAWSVVAVSSGTAALYCCLPLPKDPALPVRIPATTFVATGNVVRFSSLRTNIVDVDQDAWVQTCDIPVDLYGVLAGGGTVEDACESLGTKSVPYASRACFSFFASKIVTTGGEGGAVVCKSEKDAKQIRLFRQQGKDYTMEKHAMPGFNFRMTEMQARYGLWELRKLPMRVERCREINREYRKFLPEFKFQEDPTGGSNCWKTALVTKNRDQLIQDINMLMPKSGDADIRAKKVFCSLAEYRWLWDGVNRPETPVADWLAEYGLVLPSHWTLTNSEISEIARIVRSIGEPVEYG